MPNLINSSGDRMTFQFRFRIGQQSSADIYSDGKEKCNRNRNVSKFKCSSICILEERLKRQLRKIFSLISSSEGRLEFRDWREEVHFLSPIKFSGTSLWCWFLSNGISSIDWSQIPIRSSMCPLNTEPVVAEKWNWWKICLPIKSNFLRWILSLFWWPDRDTPCREMFILLLHRWYEVVFIAFPFYELAPLLNALSSI